MKFGEYRKLVHQSKEEKMKHDRLYAFERGLSVRLSWLLYRFLPFIQGTHVTLCSYIFLAIVVGISVSLFADTLPRVLEVMIGFGLLYAINIADKVDGEIARAKHYCTQKGVYYDRTVHAFYPVVFYLLVGVYFFTLVGSYSMLVVTIMLGVLTQQFLFFREARLLIGDQLRRGRMILRDIAPFNPRKKTRLPLPLRVIDYFTFLIYDHVLFLYIVIVWTSVAFPFFAGWLYTMHIFLSLAVNGYKVFISYPRRKLYSLEEAESLTARD